MNVFDEIQEIIDSRHSCYCPECRKFQAAVIRQVVASDLRRRAKVQKELHDNVFPSVASAYYGGRVDILTDIASEYEKGE